MSTRHPDLFAHTAVKEAAKKARASPLLPARPLYVTAADDDDDNDDIEDDDDDNDGDTDDFQ